MKIKTNHKRKNCSHKYFILYKLSLKDILAILYGLRDHENTCFQTIVEISLALKVYVSYDLDLANIYIMTTLQGKFNT